MRRPGLRPLVSLAPILFLVTLTFAVSSPPAHAAGNANAKIMLRGRRVVNFHNQCEPGFHTQSTCSGYDPLVHNLQLFPETYFAYILVVNGSMSEGIAGLQCGVAYDGGVDVLGGFAPINVYSWLLCASLEFASQSPAWPAPGSGNLITRSRTRTQCTAPPGNAGIGGIAVAGCFYLAAYSPARLRLVPRPVDGLAKVATCAAAEDIVYTSPNDSETFLGALGFGMPGINPCGREIPVPVVPTTWSGIKAVVGS